MKKSFENLAEKVLGLDLIVGNKVIFTEKAKLLIYELACECKKSGIYEAAMKHQRDLKKDKTAEKLYTDMMLGIVMAPTRVHMIAIIKIYIPAVAELLKSEQ